MESGLAHLDGSAVGIALLLAGVSIVLGKTAFTVTPEPASSNDSVRINPIRPAFDTMYAAAPENGSSAARAATCTMRP